MTPDLSAFGPLRLIRPLPGGHRNAVWLAEGPNGLAVAKSTRHSANGIAWLGPLQMAARTAGFSVPHFHCTGNGAILSNGWTLEDWCDGPTFAAADLPALAPRLAQFHRAAPALPQRPGARSLPDLAHHPLPHLPHDIAHLCHAALTPFADHAIQPIHADITSANLIHTENGPALLDWDEARCDLPFLDTMQTRQATPTETRAHLAGEIISGWAVEPAYAHACATRLAHL